MRYKIFYKEDLTIMGFSDGGVPMNYPFIELEIDFLHATETLSVHRKEDGTVYLKVEDQIQSI